MLPVFISIGNNAENEKGKGDKNKLTQVIESQHRPVDLELAYYRALDLLFVYFLFQCMNYAQLGHCLLVFFLSFFPFSQGALILHICCMQVEISGIRIKTCR